MSKAWLEARERRRQSLEEAAAPLLAALGELQARLDGSGAPGAAETTGAASSSSAIMEAPSSTGASASGAGPSFAKSYSGIEAGTAPVEARLAELAQKLQDSMASAGGQAAMEGGSSSGASSSSGDASTTAISGLLPPALRASTRDVIELLQRVPPSSVARGASPIHGLALLCALRQSKPVLDAVVEATPQEQVVAHRVSAALEAVSKAGELPRAASAFSCVPISGAWIAEHAVFVQRAAAAMDEQLKLMAKQVQTDQSAAALTGAASGAGSASPAGTPTAAQSLVAMAQSPEAAKRAADRLLAAAGARVLPPLKRDEALGARKFGPWPAEGGDAGAAAASSVSPQSSGEAKVLEEVEEAKKILQQADEAEADARAEAASKAAAAAATAAPPTGTRAASKAAGLQLTLPFAPTAPTVPQSLIAGYLAPPLASSAVASMALAHAALARFSTLPSKQLALAAAKHAPDIGTLAGQLPQTASSEPFLDICGAAASRAELMGKAVEDAGLAARLADIVSVSRARAAFGDEEALQCLAHCGTFALAVARAQGGATAAELPVPSSAVPGLAELFDNARSAILAVTGTEPEVLEEELQSQVALLGGTATVGSGLGSGDVAGAGGGIFAEAGELLGSREARAPASSREEIEASAKELLAPLLKVAGGSSS